MTERVKVCPFHGSRLDAAFCNICGQRLIDEPICTCGKIVSVFDQYCGACGSALKPSMDLFADDPEFRERFRRTIRELARRIQQGLKDRKSNQ
jgi:hypothetical protein